MNYSLIDEKLAQNPKCFYLLAPIGFFLMFSSSSQRSDVENPENVTLDAERMNNFYQRALRESER